MARSTVRCPNCGHPLVTVEAPDPPSPPGAGRGPDAPVLLRVSAVAAQLGLSRSTVYQLITTGRLRVIRIGASVRIRRAELERLAAEGTG